MIWPVDMPMYGGSGMFSWGAPMGRQPDFYKLTISCFKDSLQFYVRAILSGKSLGFVLPDAIMQQLILSECTPFNINITSVMGNSADEVRAGGSSSLGSNLTPLAAYRMNLPQF